MIIEITNNVIISFAFLITREIRVGDLMKYKKSVFRTLSLITQLGISMIVPIFICVYLGNYIDSKFNLHTFIPLMVLGILAGFRNCYILVKDANKDEED